MVTSLNQQIIKDRLIYRKVTIAPLVTFRVLFGLLMFLSTVRFWSKGWIYDLYVAPQVFFPFIPGLKPLSETGMYLIFAGLLVTSLAITLGLAYRVSTTLFFLLFTYVELLDKTNYLNHYYFVSLISFLMCWLPAHRDFSLDIKYGWTKPLHQVPIGLINVLRFQMGVLYFFAGLAKMNSTWLLEAQPLKMWLSSNVYKPLIGWMFQYKLTAYAFSWFGMIYDTTIPFFLSWNKTRVIAYFFVVAFHLMTWWLFPIGMFPFIMIVITTIFFRPVFHQKILTHLKRLLRWRDDKSADEASVTPALKWVFSLFIILQLITPLRFLAYPGELFWTEQGYRFSWRVMLMEKAGQATFYVSDKDSERRTMVANYDYLTPQQEKMMATQPDMLVQYAEFLEGEFLNKGMKDPVITADVYVTLNGQPSKRYIDPDVDLTEVTNDWSHKEWILTNE